ncbi:hypothetical protein CapIbe_011127 [Capra ibex]
MRMKRMGAEGDDSSGNSYLWRKSRIFRAKHRSRVKGGQSPGGACNGTLKQPATQADSEDTSEPFAPRSARGRTRAGLGSV